VHRLRQKWRGRARPRLRPCSSAADERSIIRAPIVIANILIFLSLAVAILALLDLYLGESQKEWLSKAALRSWNWLDEADKKLGQFYASKLLAARQWQIVLTGAAFSAASFIYFAIFLWRNSGPDRNAAAIGMIIAGIIALPLGFFACAMLLRSSSQVSVLVRATAIFAVAATIGVIAYLVFSEDDIRSLFWTFHVYDNEDRLIIAVIVIVGIGMLFAMLVALWLVPLLLIIIVYGAMGLLRSSELTARRISESKKGPILATSALFGAIVAIIKAFGAP
jgi:hypothetical protein